MSGVTSFKWHTTVTEQRCSEGSPHKGHGWQANVTRNGRLINVTIHWCDGIAETRELCPRCKRYKGEFGEDCRL